MSAIDRFSGLTTTQSSTTGRKTHIRARATATQTRRRPPRESTTRSPSRRAP